MQKENLKVLVADLERAIAEIKAEVYSDTAAYHIARGFRKLPLQPFYH
jgi:hypothetical protein